MDKTKLYFCRSCGVCHGMLGHEICENCGEPQTNPVVGEFSADDAKDLDAAG